jgi:hypothetical protein
VADLLNPGGIGEEAGAEPPISRSGAEEGPERAPERLPTPPLPADPTITIPYGVRVPTFVVSPWTHQGKGPSITLDFCSILKTVLARFAGDDKPFLSDRVHASQTFESFLTAPQPRMDVPPSPTLADLPVEVPRLAPGASAIDTPYLSRKRMREGPVESHDLLGHLARMLGR